MSDVPMAIRLARLMKRRPGADIAPAGIERHDDGLRGLLHDGIIDRVGRTLLERLGIDPGEVEIRFRTEKGRLAGLGDLRCEALELLQVAARTEHEHAA